MSTEASDTAANPRPSRSHAVPESAKLIHDYRNSLLAVQFGLVALDGAWRGKDEEAFASTQASLRRELESLKALVARTNELLERAPGEPGDPGKAG